MKSLNCIVLIILVVFGFPVMANNGSLKVKRVTAAAKNDGLKKDALFNKNIMELARTNDNYRKELVTGKHSQVVLMSLLPGEEIGQEVHDVDQTFLFVTGNGKGIVNGKESRVLPDHLVFVPAGVKHNFINTGKEKMKIITIYSPAEHKPGTVHQHKSDAKD